MKGQKSEIPHRQSMSVYSAIPKTGNPESADEEARLLASIRSERPAEMQSRFDELLIAKALRDLTVPEREELLRMVEEGEQQAAERAAAIGRLAQLRGVGFDELCSRLGLANGRHE